MTLMLQFWKCIELRFWLFIFGKDEFILFTCHRTHVSEKYIKKSNAEILYLLLLCWWWHFFSFTRIVRLNIIIQGLMWHVYVQVSGPHRTFAPGRSSWSPWGFPSRKPRFRGLHKEPHDWQQTYWHGQLHC